LPQCLWKFQTRQLEEAVNHQGFLALLQYLIAENRTQRLVAAITIAKVVIVGPTLYLAPINWRVTCQGVQLRVGLQLLVDFPRVAPRATTSFWPNAESSPSATLSQAAFSVL